MGEREAYYPSPDYGDYPGMEMEFPERKAQLVAQLAEFGLSYEPRLSLEENAARTKVFEHFRQTGVVENFHGRLAVDQAKLQEWLSAKNSKQPHVGRQNFTKEQLFAVLGGMEAYDKAELVSAHAENNEPLPRPILALPKNQESLYQEYAADNRRAFVKVWDIVPRNYPTQNNSIKIADGSEVALQDLLMAGDFERLTTKYDQRLSREQNRKRHEALRFLFDRGWLDVQDGEVIVDDHAIGQHVARREISESVRNLRHNFVNVFRGLKGYTKADLQNPAFRAGAMPPRELMALPHNLQELKYKYPNAAEHSIFKPWDTNSLDRWAQEVVLESGEKANISELAVASMLHSKLHAERQPNGQLDVINPQTGKKEQLAFHRFSKMTGISPIYKQFSLIGNPLEFAKKYLPNLLKLGILQEQDFRRIGGGRTAELYNVQERKLDNPKNPYVMFSGGKETGSVRYYIGRDKIVGTETEIDRQTMSVRLLDPQLAGVIDKVGGKERLLYTFNLSAPSEIKTKQAERIKELKAKGLPPPTRQELDAWVIVDGKEMKRRIRHYDFTDYLPPRVGESLKDYGRRINELNDPAFVAKTTQAFFAEAGIGTHNLPWSEQLMLSRIVLEEKNQERLLNFARNFQLVGLRAFMSMDFDKKMGEAVLSLGEKLKIGDAAMVFVRYSKIVESANQVEEYLRQHFPERYRDNKDAVVQIRYNLLEKGKTLLADFAEAVERGDKVDSAAVVSKLIPLHDEILMFGSTIKELAREGKEINFSEIGESTLDIVDSSALTENQKQGMKSIFLRNRPNYTG